MKKYFTILIILFLFLYVEGCNLNREKYEANFCQLENKYIVEVESHKLMQYHNGELFPIISYYPYKGKCNFYNDSIIFASEAILIDKEDTIRVLSICNCNELFLEYHESLTNNYDGIAVQVRLSNFVYNKKIMISKKSPFIKRTLKTIFGEIIVSIE